MDQRPVSLFQGLIAVLLLVVAAVPAPAQDKLPGERPSEGQFLLFAFESLLNESWPEVQIEIKSESGRPEIVHVVRKGEVVTGKKLNIVTAEKVRAFVAQRERLVHDLVDHVKTVYLGDKQWNKELVEQLEVYMNILRERGEALAVALDADGQALKNKELEILMTIDRETGPIHFTAAVRNQETSYMFESTDDPFMGAFARALVDLDEEARARREKRFNEPPFDTEAQIRKEEVRLRDARLAREKMRAARNQYHTYLADKSENRPNGGNGRSQYLAKMRPDVDVAVKKLKEALAPRKEAATTLAREMAASKKWTDAETPFIAGASESERQTDLISLMNRVQVDPIETSKGDTAEAQSRLDHAAKYARLADLIPAAKNKANNYYRASFYYLAGLEANHATALTVGTDGFSTKKSTPEGKLATQYWKEYKSNNDRDMTGDVLHNYCLALCYSHEAIMAFDALKVDSKFFPFGEPHFFYDQSRMFSVAAEHYRSGLNKENSVLAGRKTRLSDKEIADRHNRLRRMYELSSQALERGILFGFNDFERAKNVRDLKALREAEKGLVRPRLTFDEIMGAQ